MIRGPKMAETIVAHPATFPRSRRAIGKTSHVATLGVIIGNREFFPDQLVAEAREDVLKLFGECNVLLLDSCVFPHRRRAPHRSAISRESGALTMGVSTLSVVGRSGMRYWPRPTIPMRLA